VAIDGATSSTYTQVPADAGKFVTVATTKTNSIGELTVWSFALSATMAIPGNLTGNAITGDVSYGQTISADGSTWQGFPVPTLSFAWSRCDAADGLTCVAIANTASTYVVSASDLGKYIKYTVTATNTLGTATYSSTSTNMSQSTPTVVTNPLVIGGRVSGNVLAVDSGSFVAYPAVTTTYQWYQCSAAIATAQSAVPGTCEAISGAVGSAYTQVASDAGTYVTVATTKTNAFGSVTSVATVASLTSVTATVVSVSSASSTARVGELVRFAVYITDSAGNPLRGVSVEVHWRVSSLNSAKKVIGFVKTDAAGRAEITYTFTSASAAQVFGTVQATSAFPTSSNSAWNMTITN
jgi:hypothetical protein